jgi:hypothetical protein
MSNAFVIINLCYVYNQWYDISCATLYVDRRTNIQKNQQISVRVAHGYSLQCNNGHHRKQVLGNQNREKKQINWSKQRNKGRDKGNNSEEYKILLQTQQFGNVTHQIYV